MFAHSPTTTARGRRAVRRRAAARLPVFAKLIAERDRPRRRSPAPRVDAGADGLTLVNTRARARRSTPRPAAPRARRRAAAGCPVPPIKPVALRAVHDVDARAARRARSSAPVAWRPAIDAVEMLLAGASAVGVGTATFRDPRAPLRIARRARRRGARGTASRASRDLIGALEERDDRHRATHRRCATASRSRSTSTTSTPRSRIGAARSRRGSASPRSGSSSTPRPAPRPSTRLQRLGLPGVRRPEAARHPDHGRARRRACSAGTASTS